VSKKHGARKKRRKKTAAIACPRCHAPADGTPGALLRALAAVLTSCAETGMPVKFAHGAGMTYEGCVLRLPDGGWESRLFAAAPMSPKPDPHGDGLDD
jgi:hypothetical protein